MVVWNEICEKCNDICDAKHFQRNFDNWTSGNNDIDKFIQDAQLSVHSSQFDLVKALEWIPYDRFRDIKYIAKGAFGKVYRTNWIDGCIDEWNNENKNWKRKDPNMFVILKSLNYLTNFTSEFINEV